ncbi:MAG: hypothetical protein JOZ29_05465 [Deltaproteobacteria bacterium]|nr:hypothetical protein [Deltaproteobacteria bacterium]
MTPDILAIIIATVLQIAGLGFIAYQVRKMNDKMIADDAAIYLQGRQVQQILREMRESLRTPS